MDVIPTVIQKKKIAVLITALQGGGAERVLSSLLNGLEQEFDFHLVLLHNSIYYKLPDNQKIFYLNSSPDPERGIMKILSLPRYAWMYMKFCKKHDIKTSISFLSRSHYVNCMSKSFGNRAKIIVSERTYVTGYFNSLGRSSARIQRMLLNNLYPKADLIIPNSHVSALDLKENFHINKNIKVIQNPVNIPDVQNFAQDPVDYAHEDFTFIHVAAFRPEKNYELLLDAFKLLDNLSCRLLLMGSGKLEPNIRNKIKGTDLEKRVVIIGRDINPYKHLSKADCFVLSSDFEGFPNVILEALACGLPVISTDCKSGPREILAPDTNIRFNVTNEIEIAEYGILTPVADPLLLSKAMRMMIEDKTMANDYKSKALRRAKNFDLPGFIDQFRQVL